MFAHHDGFQHREMREQADVLKRARNALDGAFRGPGVVHHLPFEHDLSGVGGEQPGDEIEQRCLAGAVGPDQRVDLTFGDVRAHLVQGVEAAEPLGQSLDREADIGLHLLRHGWPSFARTIAGAGNHA